MTAREGGRHTRQSRRVHRCDITTRNLNMEVVYGDTDSIMVNTGLGAADGIAKVKEQVLNASQRGCSRRRLDSTGKRAAVVTEPVAPSVSKSAAPPGQTWASLGTRMRLAAQWAWGWHPRLWLCAGLDHPEGDQQALQAARARARR